MMFTGVDLRVAARSLVRRPGPSLVSVVTLVAVVAAATVSFSVLEGVLFRPLPYPEGDRLFRVFTTSPEHSWNRRAVTRDALRVWSEDVADVEAIGGYVRMWGPWRDDLGDAEDVEGAFAFQGFFETLGVQPLIGRLPTKEEVRSGARLVVLSEALWTTRYGRDPNILGRTVRYTWTSGTVVGVMPATFAFPTRHTQWWSPVPSNFADGRTDVPQISAVARLGDKTAVDAAREALATRMAGLASTSAVYDELGVRLSLLRDEIVGDVRSGIMQLFWSVSLLLLIASVNLAILVVATTSGRKGELAVRAALGARRADLVASILIRVVLLCAVGGGLGVLMGIGLVDPVVGLLSASFPGFPRLGNVGVNLTVLGFALGITAAAAVSSGVVPALIWSNRPPWEAMKGVATSRGGRGTRRGQAGLLLLESGLAVVLMVSAGLLLRSVLSSHAVDPGFDDSRTAFLQVRFSGVQARFSGDRIADQEALREAGGRLEERLAALPMVASVGRARALPAMGGARRNLVWTPDQGQQGGASVASVEVSPGYFRAMGIPLIQGRVFEQGDGPGGEPVAVVSEQFVRSFFGDANPVGRTVVFGRLTRQEAGRVVSDDGIPMRIVGVVGDVRQVSLLSEPEPVLYLPLAQSIQTSQSAVIRTAADPRDALTTLVKTVEDTEDEVTLRQWGTLGTAIRRPLAPLRVRTVLLLALGGLGGLLTLVGVYGVVAHSASQGVHEIGIRMALGARKEGETARVVLQTLRPVLAGGVLGLGGAMLASRLVEQALYGVAPLDPLTYGSVAVGLVVTAAATAWIPARRAARVDPVRVLDEE